MAMDRSTMKVGVFGSPLKKFQLDGSIDWGGLALLVICIIGMIMTGYGGLDVHCRFCWM